MLFFNKQTPPPTNSTREDAVTNASHNNNGSTYSYCQRTGRIELKTTYPKFDPRSHQRIYDHFDYLNVEKDALNTRTLLELRNSLKKVMNEQILSVFANNDTDESEQIAQSQSNMTEYVSSIITTLKDFSADNIVTNNIAGLIDC